MKTTFGEEKLTYIFLSQVHVKVFPNPNSLSPLPWIISPFTRTFLPTPHSGSHILEILVGLIQELKHMAQTQKNTLNNKKKRDNSKQLCDHLHENPGQRLKEESQQIYTVESKRKPPKLKKEEANHNNFRCYFSKDIGKYA